MKITKLLKSLKCIHCGNEDLNFSEEKKSLLCPVCNREYLISENVPVFLLEKEKNELTKPEIHKKTGTSFKYIDHYQKDAFESDYFEIRNSGTEHGERRVREYIASQITAKNGRILDVGCGKAWVAQLFCPKGFEVVSMDIALRNTSRALKEFPFGNHSAIVADAFSLPFRKSTFDCIIASEIIEHVPAPGAFIKSLFGVLKSGGKLIITTPYKEKLQYSLCIHCNKPTPLHAHIHSFDEKILTKLYSGSNLESVNYQTFANKIPAHLRMHPVLNYLNFRLWKWFDKIMNKIYNVPSRILVVWKKR